MIEINSQNSNGTSAEMSPEKLQQSKDGSQIKKSTAANEDDKNFGFLDFDANQLANSYGYISKDN